MCNVATANMVALRDESWDAIDMLSIVAVLGSLVSMPFAVANFDELNAREVDSVVAMMKGMIVLAVTMERRILSVVAMEQMPSANGSVRRSIV